MKLTEFKNYLFETIEDKQYKLFFGSLNLYNTRREVYDKQIIIEPFRNVSLDNSNSCYTDLEINVWLGVKKELNSNFVDNEGTSLEWEDYLRDEVNDIYDLIQNSDRILILNNKHNIETTFYDADSNITSNSQAFIKFSMNLRLY